MVKLEKRDWENHVINGKENIVKIKMYKCSSCSYTNKNAGTLSHHKKTHNPDQIPCEVCSKVFISRTYMQMHKRYKHISTNCTKSYNNGGSKSHHITKRHKQRNGLNLVK